MGRYFDEDELEAEERPPDTEITLGRSALVAIPLGILLVCLLCFGLGYVVGSSGTAPAPKSAQTGAQDQEPLQATGAIPKPAATEQAPIPQPAPASTSAVPSAPGGGQSPEAVAPSAGPAQTNPQASAGASGNPMQPQVRPALPGNAPEANTATAAPNVRAALPAPAMQLMVQVAAVRNAEDAYVLVNALRQRGYPASGQREAMDGMIHVRVGPFATREEASRWQARLLGDGYNAMIQP
jgi:cell division septation protein DedD